MPPAQNGNYPFQKHHDRSPVASICLKYGMFQITLAWWQVRVKNRKKIYMSHIRHFAYAKIIVIFWNFFKKFLQKWQSKQSKYKMQIIVYYLIL